MLGSLLLILNGKMNRKLLRHCLLLKKPAHKRHFEKKMLSELVFSIKYSFIMSNLYVRPSSIKSLYAMVSITLN